jgi:hypothetical protein
MQFQLSPETLIALCGAIISVIFSRFPWVRTKFAELSNDLKSLIMLGIMAIVTLGVVLLHCNGILNAGITCDQIGFWNVVWLYFVAVASNQTAYLITPQASDVKRAKLARVYQRDAVG